MSWDKLNFMDCIQKISYTSKIAKKKFKKNGRFPIVSQEKKLINGFWDNSSDLFKCEDKGVVIFGDHTKTLKYINFDFVIGADGVKILKPVEKLDPKFFYYQLRGIQIPDLGYARHFRLLKENDLIIPPLSEQKQIVETLDKAFEKIDKAIANIKRNIENADELFESYLQNVFENKGDDWEERKIDEVATVLNGHSFKSKDFSSENNIKSIKITNVGVKEFVKTEDNYLPSSFLETYKKYKVFKGNIVIALTRTIISSGLKVAVVPDEYDNSLLNQRVAALIPTSIINDDYLYHFFCTKIVSDYVLNNVNSLMQPNLSITDLKKLLIPCPSIEKQKEIVKKLNSMSNETKKLETIYSQKIAHLEELKKSILEKAFKGELTNAA
ncbi:restriction endonuclease subunit S [Flavobacteriaceae bacterium]|nr:restriction endonuclease subunit S [Flavobacteriaceae bacterium]